MDWRCAAGVLLFVNLLVAQSPAGGPAFEAVSIKTVENGRSGLGSLRGGPGTKSPGELIGVASLKLLLMRAYDLKYYQIAGPAWLDSSRYEIHAKLPAGVQKAQVGLMLQPVLAERFGLAGHRETRPMAAYQLMLAKGGPKLRLSQPAAEPGSGDAGIPASPRFVKGADGLPELARGAEVPRTYSIVIGGSDATLYKVWGRRETMAQLADRLSAQLDRPVVDATKLQGEFDYTLSWAVEGAGEAISRSGVPPDQIETSNTPLLSSSGLSIFGALEKQLGLRLGEKRLPVEVLVIDHVDAKPTGN